MEATEKYAVADPINIGTDGEIRIKDLVNLIIKLSGKKLAVHYDLSKPEGQPRKFADIQKAKTRINWSPRFFLEDGLRRTIQLSYGLRR